MLFIYGTDAPLYHYPIVTSVMVVVNVVVHCIVFATGYDVTPWILAFGDGYHPLQWLTHNFLHIGWLHLIGNMLFLFPFGLVVEGKIGWLRMLFLYLAIGTFQGFTQQTLMLPSDPGDDADALVRLIDNPANPLSDDAKAELKAQWRKDLMKEGHGSLGASAVIFGLLAVCVLWAPVNNFDVYFRWGLFMPAADGGVREWAISTVCAIFVAKEVFMFWLMGLPISSEALHLNGFIVGGACGLAMLLGGLVDCEGYDLISYLGGKPFKAKSVIAREKRERAEYLESLKPTGPPQAVVPMMPHQVQASIAARTSGVQPRVAASTTVATIRPAAPVAIEPLPTASPETASLFDNDLALPDFDDGIVHVDPIAQARENVETMIARGEYALAVRELAAGRKLHAGFVISAAAMGRLAEGLIALKHSRPAMTVLAIGCDAYPAHAPQWRIRIATLHLVEHRDPIAAIKQLTLVDKEMLDSRLRDQYIKVARHAKAMANP